MSQIVELLQSAAEIEKQAYYNYVKAFASSGISTLVKGGVGFEKAAKLMQETCQSDKKIKGLGTNFVAFEKAAEYVIELETKVSELEKIAATFVTKEEIETSKPLSKLASIGFTQEEIEYMSSLPENLIEKVASSTDGSKPWEMGGGAGLAREKTDPLLEFILS